MVIDMSSIVDAVRCATSDDDVTHAERACIRSVHPILVSHMDPNVCHSFLNSDVDPCGIIRRALCLMVTVPKSRGLLWFFDWYASMVSVTQAKALHNILDLLMTHLMLPFVAHAINQDEMSIDAIGPLIFFAPYLTLDNSHCDSLMQLLVARFSDIYSQRTFFFINSFVCEHQGSVILEAYVDYILDRRVAGEACLRMMTSNGMTSALTDGKLLVRLVDAWLRTPHHGTLRLLTDVMSSSLYATVRVHDYFTCAEECVRTNSYSTGVLVHLVLTCMPYAKFEWERFDASHPVWRDVRALTKQKTTVWRAHAGNDVPWTSSSISETNAPATANI